MGFLQVYSGAFLFATSVCVCVCNCVGWIGGILTSAQFSAVPSLAPKRVRTRSVSALQIEVIWEALPAISERVLGYEVRYEPPRNDYFFLFLFSPSSNYMIIEFSRVPCSCNHNHPFIVLKISFLEICREIFSCEACYFRVLWCHEITSKLLVHQQPTHTRKIKTLVLSRMQRGLFFSSFSHLPLLFQYLSPLALRAELSSCHGGGHIVLFRAELDFSQRRPQVDLSRSISIRHRPRGSRAVRRRSAFN